MVLTGRPKFLGKCKDEKLSVKIYLTNGTMLVGKVTDFDMDSVEVDTHCLVFNYNIVSIKF